MPAVGGNLQLLDALENLNTGQDAQYGNLVDAIAIFWDYANLPDTGPTNSPSLPDDFFDDPNMDYISDGSPSIRAENQFNNKPRDWRSRAQFITDSLGGYGGEGGRGASGGIGGAYAGWTFSGSDGLLEWVWDITIVGDGPWHWHLDLYPAVY